ncbi:MAG: response regulator [bacterium]
MEINTILVVDDEDLMRDLISEMLKDKAKSVIPAQNGPEALEIFMKIPKIEMIITDMNMPCMNGLQLLEKIRQIDPIIPVIVMTGYSEIFGIEESLKSGVEEYIKKPFKKGELEIIVDRAMWRAASKKRNIMLEYIIVANELIAKSNKPNKEQLLIIGERIKSSINGTATDPAKTNVQTKIA